MGLLGIALEEVMSAPYGTVINDLISGPLGLDRTRIVPTASDPLALGYGRLGRPLPPGSQGALAGAGDLRSCAADLTSFARLGLGEGPDELVQAARTSLAIRFPVGDGSVQALGWRVWRLHGDEWPGHGGDSAGYRSSMSIHPPSGTAVVALSNGTRGIHKWFDGLVPELYDSLRPG
jgi:CubicO group peptidase (beta-lactamase class C family)